MNIDDPYRTKSLIVHVETINEDALHSEKKVYEVVEGSVATVKVSGKRSIIDNLASDDIRATADLSELSSVNAIGKSNRAGEGVFIVISQYGCLHVRCFKASGYGVRVLAYGRL